jgi:hypothetical protein
MDNEYPTYEFSLNYEDANAVIERKDRARGHDTLELCIMRRAIDNEIMRLTGMEVDDFLDGMRRMFEPV